MAYHHPTFFLLQFWKSEVQNQGVSGSALLKYSVEKVVPNLFQDLEASHVPWLVATS